MMSMRGRPWEGAFDAYIAQYVDDGTMVGLTGLPHAEDAAEDLRQGRVLIQDELALADDGTATLAVERWGTGGEHEDLAVAEVPAAVQPWDRTAYDTILTPQAAEELGLATARLGSLLVPVDPPDDAALAAVRAALEELDRDLAIEVERYPADSPDVFLLALVGAALLIGAGATWVSVGLAAAEFRPDLATLAAVGASPGTRRRVVGAQAAVLAVTGVWLGVLTGTALGVALGGYQANQDQYAGWETVVPWPALAGMALVIPLVTVLGAMVVTRSRLPLVRRIE